MTLITDEKLMNYNNHTVQGVVFCAPDYYEIMSVVGKGAYGVVVSAKDIRNGELVAIKKISKILEQGEEMVKRIAREIKILKHLRGCENVVELKNLYFGKCETEKATDAEKTECKYELYIVTKFMEDTLRGLCSKQVNFTAEHIQFIVYQILLGLQQLQKASVIHRDIKPHNILVDENCHVRICDFGLARTIDEENTMSSHYVQTRWYRAPELVMCYPHYNYKIDIWSVGCILAELLLTCVCQQQVDDSAPSEKRYKHLFPGKNAVSQLHLILKFCGTPEDEASIKGSEGAKKYVRTQLPRMQPTNLTKKFPNVSQVTLDLLSKMLTFDPDNRISVDEALQHSYFDSLKEDEDDTHVIQGQSDISELEIGNPAPFHDDISDRELSIDSLYQKLIDEVWIWQQQDTRDSVE